MKENDEIEDRAARGDENALLELRDLLAAQRANAQDEAVRLLSAIRGAEPMTKLLRQKLLRISRNCVQLGGQVLAEALLMAAERDSAPFASKPTFSLKVGADRERRYKLYKLDNYLRLQSLAKEYDRGYIPSAITLEFEVSYILFVETQKDEPKVIIPLYFESETSVSHTLNIDLREWQGLGYDFVWIPEFSCSIGGDVAARDSLPSMMPCVGPIAVCLKQVQTRDYLLSLAERGMITVNSRYFPKYMDKPLVEFSQNTWKMLDIPVKDGHNWLDVPITGVDFDCAKWYCSNYYLPEQLVGDLMTEFEWEAISRGPDGRLFPWGDIYLPRFSNIAIPDKSLDEGLEPVSFRKTDVCAFGLFDCSGNAEEWCNFGCEDAADAQPGYGIARGGSWYNPVQPSRLASRVVRHADYRHKKLSFRIAVRRKQSCQ